MSRKQLTHFRFPAPWTFRPQTCCPDYSCVSEVSTTFLLRENWRQETDGHRETLGVQRFM